MARRILIVDDSAPFRRGASELLAMRGYEVPAAAEDGEAALATVDADCPDGVLLDINLPGRDGFAIAGSLSSLCPTARIVLTSSDTEDVSESELASCGARAFVPKTALATTDLEQLFGF